MKQIRIFDVTLREFGKKAEQVSFREKVETVKLLVKIGVDGIETAKITNPKVDSLFIHTISSIVGDKPLVCQVGLSEDELNETWNALSSAKNPVLQVSVPTSAVQMEYNCHLKPKALLEALSAQLSRAVKLGGEVEFVAEDATRSDGEFLVQAVKCAVSAGVKAITFKDSAGTALPEEVSKFFKDLYGACEELKTVRICYECSDAISMGVATAITAIGEGVAELKTAIGTSDVLPLKSLAKTLRAKGDQLGIKSLLNDTLLEQSVSKIEKLLTSKHGSASASEGGIKSLDEDFTLEKDDDLNTVKKCVSLLGYELSDEDVSKVYERFSSLAEKKRIGAKELDAIVASCAMQVTPTYKLVSYVINSGNLMTATANIVLEKDGETLNGISLGDGPIDASFIAIEKIIGRHYELDDFQIQSVTEGREAVGEALVKLRAFGKLYSGRGISTDIIGASIRAYVNALNKICFDNSIG